MMADFFLKKDELGNTEYIKISAAKEKNKVPESNSHQYDVYLRKCFFSFSNLFSTTHRRILTLEIRGNHCA